ncbi:MAG: EAL domain-containing protein [Burkholderiaceae bacterium]|nr:EAL domain-containing protein [Burkholderiaceae bacterium]
MAATASPPAEAAAGSRVAPPALLERIRDEGRSPRRRALLVARLNRTDRLGALAQASESRHVHAEIARRLNNMVRQGDCYSMVSADEIWMLVDDLASEALGELAGRTLVETLGRPVAVRRASGDETIVGLRPVVGVATCEPLPVDDPLALVALASRAANQAARRDDRIKVLRLTVDEDALHRDEIERGLRIALNDNALDVHFQPQIDLHADRCVSAEALIRWIRPDGRSVDSGLIASICEERGMIGQLTQLVLNTSLRYQMFWKSRGLDIAVSLNLSAVSLADASFPDVVEQALTTWGVAGDRLTLELTESAIVQNEASAVGFMSRLKALGCKLAIDDFGTGYSSFSYLRQFPLDELKIDQCFVRNMVTDRGDAQIVRALIDLAHTFDLHALAEGVEDEQTIAALRGMGCDRVQGYHYSRALAPRDLPEFIEAFNGGRRDGPAVSAHSRPDVPA